jgi:hypothetical protein
VNGYGPAIGVSVPITGFSPELSRPAFVPLICLAQGEKMFFSAGLKRLEGKTDEFYQGQTCLEVCLHIPCKPSWFISYREDRGVFTS